MELTPNNLNNKPKLSPILEAYWLKGTITDGVKIKKKIITNLQFYPVPN
jgi:hypothetical protein